MKKTYFQKYLFKIIRNKSKIPYEILTFFLGKLDKKLFVWQSSYPGILDTEFGSIWKTPWTNKA